MAFSTPIVPKSGVVRAPSVAAIVELLKPITWFPPVWAYGCGAISAGYFAADRWPEAIAGAILAGPLVCGTSQAANDWFDRHVDAINEPGRPIPSGRVPGQWGLWIAITGSVLSILFAAALGTTVLIAAVAALVLGWAYSAPPIRLKRNTWVSTAVCGACYEGLPWFTGAAAISGAMPAVPVITLAVLYSAGGCGILMLNDFKSVEGDRRLGLLSIPVHIGIRNAALLACAAMALPQAFAAVALAHWDRPLHAAAIAALLCAQCLLMRRLVSDPERHAPWYNATGTLLFVAGMLVSAFAVRTLA